VSPVEHRIEVTERVDLGFAELIPDPKRRSGWLLMIDGVAQSYVDLADPTHLEFEYVRRVASVIDSCTTAWAPLQALHLGGGAMTIPRYVAATRAGSQQIVIERDAGLALLIHRHLPVPRKAGIEIRITDARTAVAESPDSSYDLIVLDAYEGAAMPRELTGGKFTRQVARVLRPGGTYIINVTDLPALAFSRVQAATLRDAFGDVCVVAEPGMLRGRRFGNLVLAAAHRRGTLRPAAMGRRRGDDVAPGRVLRGPDLDAFIAGALPAGDDDE
jgi:spermidine synthase